MLKKIGLAVAALIVILLVIIATRRAAFHIERSATIAAPPAIVFAYVEDFHRWSEWAPWDKLDTAMKKDYEGGPGPGARYHWIGNDKVGEGRMTITGSRPPEQVDIKLEFLKPFEATNETTFTFQPVGGGTRMTWAMDGNNNFMGKAFALFNDMDAMIGKDFEAGLATLKGLAEAAAAKAAAPPPAPAPTPTAPSPAPKP